MIIVADSEEGDGPLQALAAAFASPSLKSGGSPAPTGAGATPQQPGGQQQSPGASDGSSGGSPAPRPRSVAAAAFAEECGRRGVEPDPQLLRQLQEVDDEVYYSPAEAGARVGHGGAVLELPPGAGPQHCEALLALVAGLGPPPAGSPEDCEGPFYLRVAHLSLSGHPVPTALLRQVAEAAHRRRQRSLLTGLCLAGCQLTTAALDALAGWRAVPLLDELERLVLADNPQLGAGLAPCRMHPLERLFVLAPLRLLDLRHTGMSDVVLCAALARLATYTSMQDQLAADRPQGLAPGAEAPRHPGCRGTLEALKLGPPAGGAAFSPETVAALVQAMEALPRLQALEVEGLSPEAAAEVQGAWERVQQQRGGLACSTATPSGGLRLTVTPEGARVPAEQLPAAHIPLEPPTPEPQAYQQEMEEVQQRQQYQQYHQLQLQQAQQAQQGAVAAGAHQRQPQQQPLTNYLHGAGSGRAGQQAGGRPRQQVPRVPGAWPAAPGRARGYGAAGPADDGSGWPAEGPAAGGAGVGRLAAMPAGEHGAAPAGGPPRQRRRRQAGGAAAGDRPYRGGARADELPDHGRFLGSEENSLHEESDDYMGTDEEESYGGSDGGSGGTAGAGTPPARRGAPQQAARAAPGRKCQKFPDDPEYSSLSDHPELKSDSLSTKHYPGTLKKCIWALEEKDSQAGKRAKWLKARWMASAFNATDRWRFERPSSDQNDTLDILDHLLELKELFAQHGIRWHFPMPRTKKDEVRRWRERQQREKQLAEQQAEKEQEQEAAEEAERAQRQQAARKQKRLRRAGELEVQALEDSQNADDEGEAAGARPAGGAGPSQRQPRRGQLVLSDSEDEEEEEEQQQQVAEEAMEEAGAAVAEEQQAAAEAGAEAGAGQQQGQSSGGGASPAGAAAAAGGEAAAAALADAAAPMEVDASPPATFNGFTLSQMWAGVPGARPSPSQPAELEDTEDQLAPVGEFGWQDDVPAASAEPQAPHGQAAAGGAGQQEQQAAAASPPPAAEAPAVASPQQQAGSDQGSGPLVIPDSGSEDDDMWL